MADMSTKAGSQEELIPEEYRGHVVVLLPEKEKQDMPGRRSGSCDAFKVAMGIFMAVLSFAIILYTSWTAITVIDSDNSPTKPNREMLGWIAEVCRHFLKIALIAIAIYLFVLCTCYKGDRAIIVEIFIFMIITFAVSSFYVILVGVSIGGVGEDASHSTQQIRPDVLKVMAEHWVPTCSTNDTENDRQTIIALCHGTSQVDSEIAEIIRERAVDPTDKCIFQRIEISDESKSTFIQRLQERVLDQSRIAMSIREALDSLVEFPQQNNSNQFEGVSCKGEDGLTKCNVKSDLNADKSVEGNVFHVPFYSVNVDDVILAQVCVESWSKLSQWTGKSSTDVEMLFLNSWMGNALNVTISHGFF